MLTEQAIVAGRDDGFSGTLYDSSGTAIVITAGSVLRCKIYRGAGDTPQLDLSATPTANGSVTAVTAGSGAGQGGYTVTIARQDTASLVLGAYDIELELVDAGDSNKLKHVDFGVLHILGQPAGN